MDNGPNETCLDTALGFSIPDRNARGRIVRLGPVLDEILAAHDYPPPVRHLLAEALLLTSLMGSLLKSEGCQLTMQAQATGGPVGLLVSDFRDGELRGYCEFDEAAALGLPDMPAMPDLFGEGYLTITFDLPSSDERYQGIVPLEGQSLSAAVEAYFRQSEQVPALIRTEVRSGPDGCIAGGMLVQHLPHGEEGRERLHVQLDHPEWEHVAILADTIRPDELADPALSLEAIVWRLFHEEEEIRTQSGLPLTRGCRCSVQHFETVLARFPPEERREMRNDDGVIEVDCAFCSRIFPIQD